MTKLMIRNGVSGLLIAAACIAYSMSLPEQRDSGKVRIVVNRIERTSQKEIRFTLIVRNESALPVFLEGSARELSSDQRFIEQLVLEQWKDRGWHIVVPCIENAPASVIKLGPGKTLIQVRVLTNPVESPCKERHIQFEGQFRFTVEYFPSEREAKANESAFGLARGNLPTPNVAVSDSFEIPTN